MRLRAATVLLPLVLLPFFASAQAIRQEEGKLLLPPNFIQANDNHGHMILVGFYLVSLPAIPLSATIESEVQSVDASGNASTTRWFTKVFRDVCGSLRMEIDANAEGAARDERLINVQIYDATTKNEISATPWNKSAFLIQQEGDPRAAQFFWIPMPARVSPKTGSLTGKIQAKSKGRAAIPETSHLRGTQEPGIRRAELASAGYPPRRIGRRGPRWNAAAPRTPDGKISSRLLRAQRRLHGGK
jgi:hypothetical protein